MYNTTTVPTNTLVVRDESYICQTSGGADVKSLGLVRFPNLACKNNAEFSFPVVLYQCNTRLYQTIEAERLGQLT